MAATTVSTDTVAAAPPILAAPARPPSPNEGASKGETRRESLPSNPPSQEEMK